MSSFVWRASRAALAVAFALGFGVACSPSSSNDDKAQEGLATCPRRAQEKAAKTVLRCTESSISFVKTESSSGTGIVVEADARRYLLTNTHVVDPFDSADVTLGERSFEDVPVVGVDAAADIAILGPLTGADLPDPLTIKDGLDLERGDEVFLAGFPGDSNTSDLEATIAAGIVSRLRQVEEFGHTYIQTDASIGGGQSGGPLFDSSGNLVGIAGLSFAEEFALALTGRDAKAAMTRILKGEGDEYLSVPTGADAGANSGAVELADANDAQVLFLPAGPTERTWQLTVDMAARPIVAVTDLDDEILAASGNAAEVQGEVARQLARLRGGRPEDLLDPTAGGLDPRLAQRETGPGRFTIPVKAEESALVFVVAPLTDAPLKVNWRSDLPLTLASRPVTTERIEVGGKIDRIFGGFDTSVDVLGDLAQGKAVELHARSPQGDPAVAIYGPNDQLDHLTVADPEGAGIEFFDDTDDGLFGLDAKATYQAKAAGTHRFRVFSNDASTVRIRFSVADCAAVDCDEKGT